MAQTDPKPDPTEIVFQTAIGYIASISLNVAVELRIADLLRNGPRTVEELAKESSSNADALYRCLRLLASTGIFEEGPGRTFTNTPASETLCVRGHDSVHDVVRWICDPLHFRVYAELEHSVRTGEPCFDRVYGKPVFEYIPTDPREAEIFNAAMTTYSATVIPAVLEAYDFGEIGTLVDVAGGHGEVLCSILEKYPKMRGVLTDVEHVLEGAAEVIGKHGVGDRVRREVVDFFRSVPSGGDAYIMKNIIHDWDDDRARLILTNIRDAMGDIRGKVILLESVIAPGNEPHLTKFVDIEMLALPGGRERTEEEFRALLESAGLRLTRVVETQSPLSVIEAVRS